MSADQIATLRKQFVAAIADAEQWRDSYRDGGQREFAEHYERKIARLRARLAALETPEPSN